MNKYGRLYYVCSNLDSRLDLVDQRITNDVDLLMQFVFEFFLGGIIKVKSGMLFQAIVFFGNCGLIYVDTERQKKGSGYIPPLISSGLFALAFVPIIWLGLRLA